MADFNNFDDNKDNFSDTTSHDDNDVINQGNQYNQTNQNNQSNQQYDGFTNYQQPYQIQPPILQQNYGNEVSYYPPNDNKPPKKKRGKAIALIIASLVCVIAISFGSVAGYLALSGQEFKVPFFSSQSNGLNSNSSSTDESGSAANKDLPTLLQMAAKDGAMSIPKIVEKATPSVVGISSTMKAGTSTGTGIIMSGDGYIITNGHVVDGATSIMVVISSGDKLDQIEGKLVGIDTQTDLAVIKVDRTGLVAAEFGKSSDLQVGELAIAIGNPLGFELAGSVTGGIISALNRDLTIENTQLTLIQTDAAINPGNSGGPLVNSFGQVIGITSAKISSEYAEGLGFAIPIDQAKPIIDSLIQYGYVKGRPMLGISGEEITAVVAKYYNLPQGIIIRSIEPSSGAAKSDIKLGDIIVGIDGKAITTMSELNKNKGTHKAGDEVKLTVYREGKRLDINVTLTEAAKPQQ